MKQYMKYVLWQTDQENATVEPGNCYIISVLKMQSQISLEGEQTKKVHNHFLKTI